MKTASTDLFDLIHSLTGNERAYFKRFAGMHKKPSESNYLKLFEAIYTQKKYDEEALKEQFKNDKLGGYFPRAKKYLYDKVLESMRLLHKDDFAGTRLRDQVSDANFLLLKWLLKQSTKKVRQVKKEAMEANYWPDYIAALEIETCLHVRNNFKKTSYEDLVQLRGEAELAVQKYDEELNEYFNMRQMEFLLTQNTLYNQPEIDILYQNMLNAPPIQSTTAQIGYLRTLGLCCDHHLKNLLQTKQYYEQAVQLLEENSFLLKKHSEEYLFFWGRLIEITIMQLSFEESQKYLQKFKENLLGNKVLFGNDKELHRITELEYHYNSLFCLFFFGKHEEALKLLKASLEQLEDKLNRAYVSRQVQIRYMYMLIYFFQEEFEAALYQADLALALPIDHHPAKEVISTWQAFIHWELKNYDLLEHLVRNMVRYRKRHGLINASHRILLELLQRLITCQCEKSVWQEMYDKFPVRDRLKEADNFIIQGYALSKLKGKPIKEVHRELMDGLLVGNEYMEK